MTASRAFPDELRTLLTVGGADRPALTTPLPPGRLLGSREGAGTTPVMWMSDGPAPAGLWAALQEEHRRSGLWPLLLEPARHDDGFRPWASEELYPQQASSPGLHDVPALLRGWWEREAADAEEEPAVLAPFGPTWPGLAPSSVPEEDPAEVARIMAAWFLRSRPELRIGLVPAAGGAEALAACGWSGPANHSETGAVAAVLRDWERRFGARVVQAGFDTLHLSVAAPPTTTDDALLLAAEHLAFCPDNVLQGTEGLADYAEEILDESSWSFRWD